MLRARPFRCTKEAGERAISPLAPPLLLPCLNQLHSWAQQNAMSFSTLAHTCFLRQVRHNATSDKTKTVRNMVAARKEKNIEKSFQAKIFVRKSKTVFR